MLVFLGVAVYIGCKVVRAGVGPGFGGGARGPRRRGVSASGKRRGVCVCVCDTPRRPSLFRFVFRVHLGVGRSVRSGVAGRGRPWLSVEPSRCKAPVRASRRFLHVAVRARRAPESLSACWGRGPAAFRQQCLEGALHLVDLARARPRATQCRLVFGRVAPHLHDSPPLGDDARQPRHFKALLWERRPESPHRRG